ncbi:MAG TPA: hypothetical protein VFS10_23205 [Pyrinomonadaceae bacterium]|nr:hypothetical protein [Pyrinomonadaceae bacterium]
MKISLALLLCCLCCGPLAAESVAQKAAAVPRFESYPARVYRGRVARVNLRSARGAGTFRTRLREGAKEGVNFAGHFSLVGWGCGTGCMSVAVIDAKNGAVHFPKELNAFGVWLFSEDGEVLTFKPDSRLLILSGFPNSETESAEPKAGLYYYEWTGRRLRLVKFVEKRREMGAARRLR